MENTGQSETAIKGFEIEWEDFVTKTHLNVECEMIFEQVKLEEEQEEIFIL